MNFADVLLPAMWFRWEYRNTRDRWVHLWLLASCDADGLCAVSSEPISEFTGSTRKEVVQSVQQLSSDGRLALYFDTEQNNRTFAWLPHGGGAFRVSKPRVPVAQDMTIPAPRKPKVIETLTALWGRKPSIPEAQSACPRAWGKKRKPVKSDKPPSDDVNSVFEAWRTRQKRPNACRLGNASKRLIKSALSEADADSVVLLFKYAYESDEPGPRYWRGENNRKATYLGLDNLLRLTKLAGRIQLAMEWAKTASEQATEEDGTTLGPMAAYRASRGRVGPRGTTSESPDGAPRLSAQCARILALFQQRADDGVRTNELADIARKYTGRISELRGHGADISIVERGSDGNNLYVMHNTGTFTHSEIADVVD